MTTPYFIEEGEGYPLLLLHSGGMSSEEWRRHIPALARQFRVIAPDLPGHGHTPPPADEPLSIGAMARAVRTLLDELGIAEAHVLGSSMGGAVALRLTLDTPERVSRLVLYRAHYTKDPTLYRHTLEIANPDRWRQLGLDKWLSTLHAPQGGPDAWQQVIRRVADLFNPETTDHRHTLDDLRRITAPTLIIVGDRDPLVPLDAALDMYRAIPTSALWVLPNATHITAANTWRRDYFDLEVVRFLKHHYPMRKPS